MKFNHKETKKEEKNFAKKLRKLRETGKLITWEDWGKALKDEKKNENNKTKEI